MASSLGFRDRTIRTVRHQLFFDLAVVYPPERKAAGVHCDKSSSSGAQGRLALTCAAIDVRRPSVRQVDQTCSGIFHLYESTISPTQRNFLCIPKRSD